MELNDFSSQCLTRILAEFPSFQGFISAGPENGCFSIRFDSPSGLQFWIMTEEVEERATVGFGSYHCHFGGWAESDFVQDSQNAIDFIRGLMSGDYEVAIAFRNGEVAGASCVLKGEQPTYWENEEGIVLEIQRWS